MISLFKNSLIIIALLSVLIGCSHQNIEDYSHNKPSLDVVSFFNGPLEAKGVVKDRQDKVIRYFIATINASWNEGVGTLDEKFIFDDGEKQSRIWTLTPTLNGSFLATANDVIGEHPMHISGNALFMEYILRIPYNGKTLDVSVDDKMFLVDDDTIINESLMTKWGFHVATVQLSIRKISNPL